MRRTFASVVVALIVCQPHEARADEVTLIAPGGIRAAIEKMIPDFERATGHEVKAPPFPDVLASGHVVATSETPLATMAVAVRTCVRGSKAARLRPYAL